MANWQGKGNEWKLSNLVYFVRELCYTISTVKICVIVWYNLKMLSVFFFFLLRKETLVLWNLCLSVFKHLFFFFLIYAWNSSHFNQDTDWDCCHSRKQLQLLLWQSPIKHRGSSKRRTEFPNDPSCYAILTPAAVAKRNKTNPRTPKWNSQF